MSSDPWSGLSVDLLSPAKRIAQISSGSDENLGEIRGLNCDNDVRLDITSAEGDRVNNVPFHKGYNPIRITKIHTIHDANVEVWAMF